MRCCHLISHGFRNKMSAFHFTLRPLGRADCADCSNIQMCNQLRKQCEISELIGRGHG